VPLELYWSAVKVKLEIGLAKGKQSHDKRATEKDRDWQREKAAAACNRLGLGVRLVGVEAVASGSPTPLTSR
jgi:hypothetical protein